MEWVNVWEMQVNERSGPEWMAAVCAPAMALKQHMSTLEMSHPLGRLWDIDIIDSDGKSLSRRELWASCPAMFDMPAGCSSLCPGQASHP